MCGPTLWSLVYNYFQNKQLFHFKSAFKIYCKHCFVLYLGSSGVRFEGFPCSEMFSFIYTRSEATTKYLPMIKLLMIYIHLSIFQTTAPLVILCLSIQQAFYVSARLPRSVSEWNTLCIPGVSYVPTIRDRSQRWDGGSRLKTTTWKIIYWLTAVSNGGSGSSQQGRLWH